jgi:hypothetical protein
MHKFKSKGFLPAPLGRKTKISIKRKLTTFNISPFEEKTLSNKIFNFQIRFLFDLIDDKHQGNFGRDELLEILELMVGVNIQ